MRDTLLEAIDTAIKEARQHLFEVSRQTAKDFPEMAARANTRMRLHRTLVRLEDARAELTT